MRRFSFLFIMAAIVTSCVAPRQVVLSDDALKTKLKRHIATLASDEFEGREAGTNGELLAKKYIESQFKEIGIKPRGEKKFAQEFSIVKGGEYGSKTQFYLNTSVFKLQEDFYPLAFSGNGVVTGYVTDVGFGIYAPTLQHNDYFNKINIAKKIFFMEAGFPDGGGPHGKFTEYDLKQRVEYAITQGASAVIFINSDTSMADPAVDFTRKFSPVSIPVIFAKGKAANMLKNEVITMCTVGAEVNKIEKPSFNVAGYIDNKAQTTVVIGAHYDHLGYGTSGSLHRGEKAIHNGADDNASGVAALIELSRYLNGSPWKNNNYLFIAFSAEEIGLLGSNYFVKHSTVNLKSINYMLNMDMIGRVKEEEPAIIINGFGTSGMWKEVIDTSGMNGLKIKTTESGVGPSDHTSFYLNDIPVLHFFSGTHSDYHKPEDDELKINYNGMVSVFHTITGIVDSLDRRGKLPFVKTKDDTNENTPRFKVTLGVVPDYAFSGDGMRIDGVTEGKPAANAGLQKGDVVIQIGDHVIGDMMTYMKALGKFNKGETTTVKVKRGTETIELAITF